MAQRTAISALMLLLVACIFNAFGLTSATVIPNLQSHDFYGYEVSAGAV